MSNKALFGLLLVILGAALILNSLFGIFSSLGLWWPLLIIFIGLFQIIKRSASFLTSLLVIVFGFTVLLGNLNLIQKELIFPIALILLGCWFIFSRAIGKKVQVSMDRISYFPLFSGIKAVNTSQNFTGGSVAAVFGGADIDLRNARLSEKGAVLELTAVFGGIDIIVPESWNVHVAGTPLFGGLENKTRIVKEGNDDNNRMVHVYCTAIFGGVTIKN